MGNNNIVLVGFMAAGKTTIGRLLSNKMNFGFVDTDQLIEQEEGTKISQIFESKGEQYFRRKESEILELLKDSNKTVISTGGGMVVSADNRAKLKSIGRVVYLEASPYWILNNLNRSNVIRPLLSSEKDPLNKIGQLLDNRREYYEEVAEIKIIVDNKALDEILQNIIFAIEN